MELHKTVKGAMAGAAAAAAWAAQQPIDKRLFRYSYDDVEMLGKTFTRGPSWPLAGALAHLSNGAVFGAGYSLARPFLPGPPAVAALMAVMAEHLASWPLTRLVDSHHPAREDIPPLAGNTRAFAQATWRHLVFALVLGELERRLNPEGRFEPPPEVPVGSNGHGNIERAAVGAA